MCSAGRCAAPRLSATLIGHECTEVCDRCQRCGIKTHNFGAMAFAGSNQIPPVVGRSSWGISRSGHACQVIVGLAWAQ
jgi:hypothetical protein